MWDAANLEVKSYRDKRCGIPHLAKHERDMGLPVIFFFFFFFLLSDLQLRRKTMTEATIVAPAPGAAAVLRQPRSASAPAPPAPFVRRWRIGSVLYRSTQASSLFVRIMPRLCSKRSWVPSTASRTGSASEELPVAADEPVAVSRTFSGTMRFRSTILLRRLKTLPLKKIFSLSWRRSLRLKF